jgi:hypothetical protein
MSESGTIIHLNPSPGNGKKRPEKNAPTASQKAMKYACGVLQPTNRSCTGEIENTLL